MTTKKNDSFINESVTEPANVYRANREPIDLTLEDGQKFIVDEMLINNIVTEFASATFSQIKQRIIEGIEHQESIEDINGYVTSTLYMYRFANHPNLRPESY